MDASRCRCLFGLLVGLLFLAACSMPKVWIEDALLPTDSPPPTTAPPVITTLPPTTTPEDTPAPLPTHLPTPYASGRVTGQVCLAGVTVYLRSCCPPYEAREKSDASGFFVFGGELVMKGKPLLLLSLAPAVSDGLNSLQEFLRGQRLLLFGPLYHTGKSTSKEK